MTGFTILFIIAVAVVWLVLIRPRARDAMSENHLFALEYG